jgi:predicted ATPase
MRINQLKISAYKNLRELQLCLSPRQLSQVIIGQNGSGKSNLLEAIVEIFRNLDLDEPSSFSYELDYTCWNYDFHVVARKGEPATMSFVVTRHGKRTRLTLSQTEMARGEHPYLPQYIFTYYSGKNERLERLFYQHQQNQYEKLRGSVVEDEETNQIGFKFGDSLLRRLFYCRRDHSPLVLLSFLIELEQEKQNGQVSQQAKLIQDYLSIKGLVSALFVVRKPRRSAPESAAGFGDERFWNATGVLSEFLSVLWENALVPISDDLRKIVDFRGIEESQDTLYLYLDRERLLRAVNSIGDGMIFFRQLEAVYMADYLDEVRIKIDHHGHEEPLSYIDLSEGQQQLITVLGLMQFTRQDEALFLLDEPDTHLNPLWKYNYFSMVESIINRSDPEAYARCQLLLTTHDPLMLGSLLKEQVRVITTNEERKTHIFQPAQNPRGMGFSGLLRSDMFGLRSTVDPATLKDLDRRNYLYALTRQQGSLSAAEEQELADLSTRLEELGFGREFRDPLYQLFAARMALHTRFHKSQLTPEELKEQERIADQIIDELLTDKARE